jgi:hypothetical protein
LIDVKLVKSLDSKSHENSFKVITENAYKKAAKKFHEPNPDQLTRA